MQVGNHQHTQPSSPIYPRHLSVGPGEVYTPSPGQSTPLRSASPSGPGHRQYPVRPPNIGVRGSRYSRAVIYQRASPVHQWPISHCRNTQTGSVSESWGTLSIWWLHATICSSCARARDIRAKVFLPCTMYRVSRTIHVPL